MQVNDPTPKNKSNFYYAEGTPQGHAMKGATGQLIYS